MKLCYPFTIAIDPALYNIICNVQSHSASAPPNTTLPAKDCPFKYKSKLNEINAEIDQMKQC